MDTIYKSEFTLVRIFYGIKAVAQGIGFVYIVSPISIELSWKYGKSVLLYSIPYSTYEVSFSHSYLVSDENILFKFFIKWIIYIQLLY